MGEIGGGFMHITSEQLQNLAHSYVKNERLNDEQLQLKRHMAQCDSCYEKFCTEFTVLKSLFDIGFITEEALKMQENLETELHEETKSEMFLLKLEIVDNAINFIHTTVDSISDAWNFFRLPQLAASRGETKKQVIYQSPLSEYSCIRQEDEKLIIQLEEEHYPVEQLQVKYVAEGAVSYKEFEYDEKIDCHIVVLSEEKLTKVEIVEKD